MTKQVSQELLDHIKQKNAETRAWVEAGENRWAGYSPEEPEFWADRGVYTLDDLERWDLESTISDVHKEAYGFRPRGYNFSEMPLDELRALYDRWAEAARQAFDEERAREEAAVEEFENRIESLIEMGAGDRDTAIRWFLDGMELDEFSLHDAGFVCYELGLPYSMETVFQPFLAEMRNAAQEEVA